MKKEKVQTDCFSNALMKKEKAQTDCFSNALILPNQEECCSVSKVFGAKQSLKKEQTDRFFNPLRLFVGKSTRLVIERLRVRILAEAVGENSSLELTFCTDSYSVSVPSPCYCNDT